MLCGMRLSYSNNTSSMLRHLSAKRGGDPDPAPEIGQHRAVGIDLLGSCKELLMPGCFLICTAIQSMLMQPNALYCILAFIRHQEGGP